MRLQLLRVVLAAMPQFSLDINILVFSIVTNERMSNIAH